MDYDLITNEFYSHWFKEDVRQFIHYEGIKFIELQERDENVRGFGKPFIMYLYIDNKKLYISYSKK